MDFGHYLIDIDGTHGYIHVSLQLLVSWLILHRSFTKIYWAVRLLLMIYVNKQVCWVFKCYLAHVHQLAHVDSGFDSSRSSGGLSFLLWVGTIIFYL